MISMRNLFLVVILSIIALYLNVNTSIAQNCPTGSTLHTMQVQYPGTNCVYDIKFCYTCNSTIGNNKNISGLYFFPSNPDEANCEIPYEDLVDWAVELIIAEVLELCEVPPCNEYGSSYTTISVKVPLCKKTKNVTWVNPDESIGNYFSEIPCEDGGFYCIKEVDVCYDNISGNYITLDTRHTVTGNACILKVYANIPPVGMTYEDDWESECYYQGDTCP